MSSSDMGAGDMERPTFGEMLAQEPNRLPYPPNSKKWYTNLKEDDQKAKDKMAQAWQVPRDPRFPQQNITKWCYNYYLDYQRCKELKGEDYKPCEFFKRVYTAVCPMYWVEKWDEWVDEGIFPGKFDR